MKNRKITLFFVLMVSLVMLLAACGQSDKDKGDNKDNNQGNKNGEVNKGNNENNANNNEGNTNGEATTDFSAGMVTDIGGVDDKSFNQSAWEGLISWGDKHGLSKGNGYDYAQSNEKADYVPNLTRLIRDKYDLIFGIGFELQADVDTISQQYPDTHFAIVDDIVEQDNVASIMFKEHQGSFLVGVAAAMKTETNKVGFVGGIDSPLINKFESGFIAGVKSVNPEIDVKVEYAESFGAADKGKIIASNMYNNGIDIIYHAAGGTGNGVFNEARDLKKNDPDRSIWVIGVDRDQHEEGVIDDHNITLTSMIKRVDVAVEDVTQQAMDGKHHGGELLEYGLEDDAIGFATTNKDAMTDDIIDAVNEWKEKIFSGEVKVPQTRDETTTYLDSL